MDKGFIHQIIVNKKIVFFVTFLVFIGGIYSYLTSIKQESPDFDIPIAIINLTYLGASADEVESQVVRPLEKTFSQIAQIKSLTSFSRANSASIYIEFDYDVDRKRSFDEVRRRLDDSLLRLPEGLEVIDFIAGDLPVTDFMYVLRSTDDDMTGLKKQAIDIKETIESYTMVSSVHIQGQQASKITLDLKPSVFNSLPITRSGYVNLITSYTNRMPGGRLNSGTFVQSDSALSSLDDLKDLVITYNAVESPVTLSNIVDIESIEEDTYYTNYDGKQAILIYGYFKDNLDMTTFADSFKEKINKIDMGLYKLDQVIYYPEDVKASNNDFFTNLLIGMMLVVLISFFTMGIRNALVVSLALPTSVMMTLIVMKVIGIKLHQVSIAAMIIAIGMLVDNAIVITESIKTYVEDGVTPMASAILGTRDVMLPVLTSTLTTIAAFSPLLFIPSIAGDYIESVPKVIIISLTASYLVSISLMPCLSYIFFTQLDKPKDQGYLVKITSGITSWLLKFRLPVLVLIILIAGYSLTLLPKMGLSFFPTADKNMVYVNVTNKSGGLDVTREIMSQLETIIKQEEEVSHYLSSTGIGLPRFWDTMRPFNASDQFGQFLLVLNTNESKEYILALQERLNDADENTLIEVKALEKSEPILAPVAINISSDNLDELQEALTYSKDILAGIEGVTFIRDDAADMTNQYMISYDISKLSERAVALPQAQLEVFYAINGHGVAKLDLQPVVMLPSVDGVNDLSQLIVSYDQAKPIFLKDVASISEVLLPVAIKRSNQKYMVTLLSDVKSGYASTSIMNQFKDQLDKTLHQGVAWDYAGEQASIIESFADMGMMAMFAVFLILIILLLQFKSFRQTGLILLSIPLAAAGAIYGLYFTGYDISFTGLFGMVSLMGIVVNDAILLVDSINQRVKEGLAIRHATEVGSKRRIRPILLTTITTFIGLIPLMVSGSKMFAPMAIAIGSGLLFATLVTLLIIPILYGFLYKGISR